MSLRHLPLLSVSGLLGVAVVIVKGAASMGMRTGSIAGLTPTKALAANITGRVVS